MRKAFNRITVEVRVKRTPGVGVKKPRGIKINKRCLKHNKMGATATCNKRYRNLTPHDTIQNSEFFLIFTSVTTCLLLRFALANPTTTKNLNKLVPEIFHSPISKGSGVAKNLFPCP